MIISPTTVIRIIFPLHFKCCHAKPPKQITLMKASGRQSLYRISFAGNKHSWLRCITFCSALPVLDSTVLIYINVSVLQLNNFPLWLPQKGTARIPFHNFPCDLPLSRCIFRKISVYQDNHRDEVYSSWTNPLAWTFSQCASRVRYKLLSVRLCMLAILYYAEGTHLTTDVINSHVNEDGCLFYAFQVHVSVTWNRVNKADKELRQMIGRASRDFPFVDSHRN